MFAAKPRGREDDTGDQGLLLGDSNHARGDGDEMQLLRLMQEGKVTSSNKGRGHRQRTRPRKKKFSALKKNVLKERLRKWQELHPPPQGGKTTSSSDTHPSRTVCIYGFAEPDLLQDEDELEELLNNLNDMAAAVAPFDGVFIPTLEQLKAMSSTNDMEDTTEARDDVEVPAFVQFADIRGAEAAVSCWSDLTMGGQKLKVMHVPLADNGEENSASLDNGGSVGEDWGKRCLDWVRRKDDPSSKSSSTRVVLENVLTEDDLEDDDCLDESLRDIRIMAEKYGTVATVEAERATKSVVVSFEDSEGSQAAKLAAENLGKTILGGTAVVARVQQETSASDESTCHILLKNALSEEDLEDEDCLEESLADLRELAGSYGTVVSVDLVEESTVKIVFQGTSTIAQAAATGFRGMVMGGVELEAAIPDSALVDSEMADGTMENQAKKEESKEPEKLFSGDKLIGDSWAECKRVPKIPNSSNRRPYATMVEDETAKPLIIEMLGELMRLQKRAVEEDKNTKTKRRLVMGLREVAKGIRTRKMKMVCMANNLDEYGAIDAKLQEILDLAYQEDVPVFFELSKRGLGKAIGKTIKVAVIGIQNAEGAHQIFKKLVKMQPPVSIAVEKTG